MRKNFLNCFQREMRWHRQNCHRDVYKRQVQSGQLPDGIVCYNDQIAVQVMEELEKMGVRIPEDISITGYDNSLYAQRGNGITTIAHPQEKLGEMAAELILEKINGVPEEELSLIHI